MNGVFRHPLRVGLRLGAFVGVTGTGLVQHAWDARVPGRGSDSTACAAAWVHHWSRRTLAGIGVRNRHTGAVPARGIVVSNHLSYLDIPLLAASGPMVFVSKAEVASWPFLGSLARSAGTLFLRRDQRSHVAEIAAAFRPIVESGTVVAIFPEGTSSGGDDVLPFRPSLLEPAAANGWPVTPAWIRYEIEDGFVADEVAYWRDMSLGPHLLNLLSKRRIAACVHYGESVQGIGDRKELARRLHADVCALKARYGTTSVFEDARPG